ncbi:hypothetical protein [Rhizobium ruizarguesonis]|uniref:hypothetical protein n=1 Tax=Rhizobium ruizarguesonis TaxID=2081791 RepID=UPI001031DF10|nr:hypothetical protein [Rhizobium ruizarguesonis]TAY81987.1 hypothetical protein ELH86_24905 [Rhizobium ruizarguesonis]
MIRLIALAFFASTASAYAQQLPSGGTVYDRNAAYEGSFICTGSQRAGVTFAGGQWKAAPLTPHVNYQLTIKETTDVEEIAPFPNTDLGLATQYKVVITDLNDSRRTTICRDATTLFAHGRGSVVVGKSGLLQCSFGFGALGNGDAEFVNWSVSLDPRYASRFTLYNDTVAFLENATKGPLYPYVEVGDCKRLAD